MIFISYRRQDASDLASVLAAKLIECFGKDAVFLDKDQIALGDHWQKAIDRALSKTSIVLALIGPRWLSESDEYGCRRIDRSDDTVAYELAETLRKRIPVIPLYLHGRMPLTATAFPVPLRGIAEIQGMMFDIERDLPGLLEHLGQIPELRRECESRGPKGEDTRWGGFTSAKSEDYPLVKPAIESHAITPTSVPRVAEEANQPPFDAYSGTESYLFVSYAHKDSSAVYPELIRLRALGFRVWYDEGIDPGNEWPDEIAHAIDRCDYFIVFISPRAVESKNVRNEINFAINLDKPFLAVHLEETPLPKGLALRMGDIQAILKWRMPTDRYYRKLEKALPTELKEHV